MISSLSSSLVSESAYFCTLNLSASLILNFLISIVTVYLTLSMSESAILSTLSELVAASIVMPLRILITSSVLSVLLKKAFKLVFLSSLFISSLIDWLRHVIRIQMFIDFILISGSRSLEIAIIMPKPQIGVLNFVA